MKQKTQEFNPNDDKKHSVVFKPNGLTPQDNPIATSVYVMRNTLRELGWNGTSPIKLTITVPDNIPGGDSVYNDVK